MSSKCFSTSDVWDINGMLFVEVDMIIFTNRDAKFLFSSIAAFLAGFLLLSQLGIWIFRDRCMLFLAILSVIAGSGIAAVCFWYFYKQLFECKGMKDGGKFPIVNTGRGQDISPEFLIKNLSPSAKTLAITLEDIKHPLFKNFTHWLIWNIPAGEKVDEAIPSGKVVPCLGNARQGIGYGVYKYAGPKPPKGKQHRYRFTVYALDCEIELKFLPTKNNFIKKAKEHIIQQGSIVGNFE